MPKKPSNTPFATDGEYLDAEFAWIRTFASLLGTKKQLAELKSDDTSYRGSHLGRVKPVASTEMARQLTELEGQEKAFRKGLDARILTHRKSGNFELGMDQICEQYGLSDQERRILLILVLPAISAAMAEDILDPLNVYNGSPRVAELCGMLEPKRTEDHLKLRRLFRVDAPLIKNGLIVIEFPSAQNHPTAIHSADVYLTSKAFSTITGMPSLAEDGSDTGSDGDGSSQ